MIKIQKKDFDLEDEISSIKLKYKNVGAVSTFIGYVRDINQNQKVKSIYLEVYKEMAKKNLSVIIDKATKKWGLLDVLIIHRFGKLSIDEKIVLVAAFSVHRKDGLKACDYIMNILKKDTPFWKKEFYQKTDKWI